MRAAQAWIVRAGREDEYAQVALDRGLVGIGWRRVGDLARATRQRSVRALVADAYPHEPAAVRTLYALQLHAFRSTVEPGDLIVLLQRGRPEVAVGEVTGDYRFVAGRGPAHVRDVHWRQPRLRRSELGSDLLAVSALAAVSRVTRPDAVSRIADAAKGVAAAAEPAARPAGEPAGGDTPAANLRRNLTYAKDLAAAGSHLEALGVTAFEFRDVYRAAWVQGVASLDHWVRQEVTARTLRLLDDPDRPRPPTFGRILGKRALAEAAEETAFRRAMEDKLSTSHGNFQSANSIRTALEDVADADDLWARVAAVLEPPTGAPELEAALGATVSRRHVIVHRGDEDPENPPYKKDIDIAGTMAAIDFIDQVTAAVLLVIDG